MPEMNIPDSGVGGGSEPPSVTPPTDTGGLETLRFEVPAADEFTFQRKAKYNYLDADRQIVLSGCFRFLGLGLAQFAFGFCSNNHDVIDGEAYQADDFVGFFVNLQGVLSFRCNSTSQTLGTIEEGVFYDVGFQCPPLRGTSHRVFVDRTETVVDSSDIPDQDVGLGLCVCVSRHSAGDALIEFSRLFPMQDKYEFIG